MTTADKPRSYVPRSAWGAMRAQLDAQAADRMKLAVKASRNVTDDVKILGERFRYHGLHMEGRPYKLSLRPVLIDRDEFAALAQRLRLVHGLFERVVDIYAEHPEMRILFAEYGGHEDIILDYPTSKPRVQLCRLDCAWTGGDEFKIMEINSACPSGVVQIPMATRIWLDSEWAHQMLSGLTNVPYPMLSDPHAFTRFLTSSARSAGYQVSGAAVVNLRGTYTNEIEWIVSSFRNLGLEAQVCDARSIRERNGSIWCAGQHYQLSYNKLDPLMLMEDSMAEEYLQMFRRGRAFFVNPLVAQTIVEDKAALAVLSDPAYKPLFSADQQALIAQHVPWTRLVTGSQVTGPEGSRVNLPDYVSRNRRRLVLKPADLTRGSGVLIGPFTADDDWQRGLRSALASRYVVQEYLPLPKMEIPAPDGHGFESVYVDLSCHLLAGSLAGFFSRCSISPVVNMAAGGSCVPVIQIDAQGGLGGG